MSSGSQQLNNLQKKPGIGQRYAFWLSRLPKRRMNLTSHKMSPHLFHVVLVPFSTFFSLEPTVCASPAVRPKLLPVRRQPCKNRFYSNLVWSSLSCCKKRCFSFSKQSCWMMVSARPECQADTTSKKHILEIDAAKEINLPLSSPEKVNQQTKVNMVRLHLENTHFGNSPGSSEKGLVISKSPGVLLTRPMGRQYRMALQKRYSLHHWKTAASVFIHRGCLHWDLGDNEPMSLTRAPYKVPERVTRENLKLHLTQQSRLYPINVIL